MLTFSLQILEIPGAKSSGTNGKENYLANCCICCSKKLNLGKIEIPLSELFTIRRQRKLGIKLLFFT